MTDILKKIKDSNKEMFVGLAGPGTGKSYTFKTIIESDEYEGKRILILSFINKLIDDLKDDFKKYKNVEVSTLHSFAKREFSKLAECNLSADLDKYISEDYFLIKGKKISYEAKFQEDNITRNEKNFYISRKDFYKTKKRLYSLNSIIYAINKIFLNDNNKIPKYDLILIDEFQDFNKSEYKLINLLNSKTKVVIVGDDDQSLYDFKKANPSQIRDLYKSNSTEEFSLDYCYRCTDVIISSTNNLISNTKKEGHLKDRLDKNFLYPTDGPRKEDSKKYPKIHFVPQATGNLLAYKLNTIIRKDIQEYKEKQRVLIILPLHLKSSLYERLMKYEFTVVGVELFSGEKKNKFKHKKLSEFFNILIKTKANNLALRGIMQLYFVDKRIKKIILESYRKNKKIWCCLTKDEKAKIEKDIKIYKTVKVGKKELSKKEFIRFTEIFNLKKILKKVINGFEQNKKNAIEVELTNTISSKGLSADFVYYIGIDDEYMLDRNTKQLTDYKICEFLVGITRAKKKLTLISMKDANPKILEYIGVDNVEINK